MPRTRTPKRVKCPRCGAPVIETPAGELLNPEPHELAITTPQGRRLTFREAAAVATGRRPPFGHHPHRPGPYGCNPRPPEQLALALDL
ncbi:hypothetical protein [Streptomyces sp. NPDC047070]|uniref:hypothetical protein n=1 Tax=Streptomyces sp. NPDC047070 TaxID=3154923 RepID=UPI003453F0EE